jgi:hypothetical protein
LTFYIQKKKKHRVHLKELPTHTRMSAFVEFLIWLDPFALFISALIVFLPREHPNKLPGAIRYKLYRGPCQFISKYTALPLPCFLRRSATKWRASSTAQPPPRRILAPRDVTTCAPPACCFTFSISHPAPSRQNLAPGLRFHRHGWGWLTRSRMDDARIPCRCLHAGDMLNGSSLANHAH